MSAEVANLITINTVCKAHESRGLTYVINNGTITEVLNGQEENDNE